MILAQNVWAVTRNGELLLSTLAYGRKACKQAFIEKSRNEALFFNRFMIDAKLPKMPVWNNWEQCESDGHKVVCVSVIATPGK